MQPEAAITEEDVEDEVLDALLDGAQARGAAPPHAGHAALQAADVDGRPREGHAGIGHVTPSRPQGAADLATDARYRAAGRLVHEPQLSLETVSMILRLPT
jgi:hypothetical protein